MTLTLTSLLPDDAEGDAPVASRRAELREVFDAHAPFVWRTLRYLGVADADAQDVCQEVFLVVHQKLATFEGRSTLETWLYGICVRVAAAHRRRAYVRREIPVAETPDASREPEQGVELENRRAREMLEQALATLAPTEREVFVLFEIEERPMTEIATIVGCPLRTAYTRLNGARASMATAWARLTKEGTPR